MALRIFMDVDADERDKLKGAIAGYPGGRTAFAEKVGESYMTVSNRLNGKTSNCLQVCVADFYWKTLGEKPPVRK